jgi:hypothetical protein
VRRLLICSSVLAALLACAPAHAGDRADFAWRFAEVKPGSATRWTLHLLYKAPGDPEAKPPVIRELTLRPPAGTRFNVASHPACTASNEQIQLLGDAACPPESRVGTGRLTVMTGFGAPVDPYPTDLSLWSTRQGLIEVLKDPKLGTVFAIERLNIVDGALTAKPLVVPGGPPDFKIAAREIDWNMTSASWLTTPPSCPAGGWTSSGTFRFDDGGTATESATTPCAAPKAAEQAKKKRKAHRPAKRCRKGRGHRRACRRP